MFRLTLESLVIYAMICMVIAQPTIDCSQYNSRSENSQLGSPATPCADYQTTEKLYIIGFPPATHKLSGGGLG
ncbi:hypothetical protein GWI33_017745 [Rhynchophorus ferrugineus]|uniref:Secreted protein n=1 Tax=Rhynchophorus ferrugineus TaxID=354439 RepID=A0A834I1I9_RHYFE|nr:hypothetical protein GWI33_017745 [Rhynchophorus ferrugineus]